MVDKLSEIIRVMFNFAGSILFVCITSDVRFFSFCL